MTGEEMAAPPMVKTQTPGIYKRGGSYVVVYRDPNGRQRKQFAQTLAEARKVKGAKVADVARGEFVEQSRVTFADYAAEWIESYTGRTRRGVSEDTRAEYRRALGLDAEGNALPGRAGAVGFFGRLPLREIGPRDIRRYAAHVAARGVKPDTVRLALVPVKAMLATAAEDELIRSNPSAGLRNLLPTDETENEQEKVKALTEDELTAILAELPEKIGRSRPRLFHEFLVQTGLRFGEAIEVRWGDIEGERLHVQRRYRKGRVGLPKGRKTRRVPLTAGMARQLWTLRKDTRGADDALVFVSECGQRIDHSNTLRRVLKPAAVRAGLGCWIVARTAAGKQKAESWVAFHTFRHTCATVLFRHGWNAVKVQKHLGHSDAGFTLRRYVHLLDQDMDAPDFMDTMTGSDVGNTWATRPTENSREIGVAVGAG